MFKLDSALGIEIRKDSLAFASVSKGLQGIVIESCRTLKNFRDLSPGELNAWVQQFDQAGGLARENVIVGLPRDEVVIRQLTLPLEVEENLDQVVRFQMERFEPGEEDRSCLDYVVVARDVEKGKIVIQTLMAPAALVEEYLDLFRELNLYPAALRVSSVGLFQAFAAHESHFPKRDPYLVLDLDPHRIELVLVMGPDRFISEEFGLNGEELTYERLSAALDGFFSRIDREVDGVEGIYLSGPLAEEFLDDVQDRFGDCELLTSRLTVRYQGASASVAGRAMGAVGLAISGIRKSKPARLNLIPKEKRVIAERASLVSTAVLVGLLAVMGVAAMVREYTQQNQLLNQIEAQIEALQEDVDRSMALRSQSDQKLAQLGELQDLMRGHQKILLVLKELTEVIPDDSFLQNVNVQGDRVSMTGFSDAASSLLKVLLSSEYLGAVESRYITPDRTMKDKEKFSFEATIRE